MSDQQPGGSPDPYPAAPPQRPDAAPPPPPPPSPPPAAPPPPPPPPPGAPPAWAQPAPPMPQPAPQPYPAQPQTAPAWGQPGAPQPAAPAPHWGQPQPEQAAWGQTPPPSQQGWGQATSGPQIQPVNALATATMVALGIMTALSAASVLLELAYASAIDEFVNGSGGFQDALDAENARSGFSVVFLVGTLVTTILWVLWIQRARANATALGAGGQRQTDGMAVGGWFIPAANVYIGRQVINDLWRANDPTIPSGYRIEGKPVAGIVNAWWALWMIGWWISRGIVFAADAAFDDFDIETALNFVRMNAVMEVGFVAAGILGLLVVKQITERQRQRAALFGITIS